MNIEWDPAKAASNHSKHGIRFSDVEPAFYDQHALSMPDTNSIAEDRFVLVGSDSLGRIVFVSYTYRRQSIRLISARPAMRHERKAYEERIRI